MEKYYLVEIKKCKYLVEKYFITFITSQDIPCTIFRSDVNTMHNISNEYFFISLKDCSIYFI